MSKHHPHQSGRWEVNQNLILEKTADSAAESHQPITQMQTSIIKIFLGKGFKQYVSAEILERVGDRRERERERRQGRGGGGGEERGVYRLTRRASCLSDVFLGTDP